MKLPRFWFHVIFWLVYLLFESYLEFAWISASYTTLSPFYRFFIAFQGECFIILVIKIPLCYFFIYLINNLAYKVKRPVLIIPAIGLAVLVLTSILNRWLSTRFILKYIYHDDTPVEQVITLNRIISSFIDLIFILGVVLAIKQYRLYHRSLEKSKELLKEKLEAELKYLKNQTNPHFLFNTLNNLYALARKKADETPEVIMKLSKLLRFMLYESGKSKITIKEEIQVIMDYIELEKLRYNERLRINVVTETDDEFQPIAPLILLPFVENAFKHGASESRFETHIDIVITLSKQDLSFTIENSMDGLPKSPNPDNIGLINIKRQLELLYPAHQLSIKQTQTLFKVSLNIKLNNHATISLSDRGR
ncbi:MAG: histidine kinase [Saprospiraceae bacterium]